jgi:phosphate/sulfate permease
MGVGGEKISSVNWGIVKDMVWAWVLTFSGLWVDRLSGSKAVCLFILMWERIWISWLQTE